MRDKLYRKVQINHNKHDDYIEPNKATRQRLERYYKEAIDNGIYEHELIKYQLYDNDMDWYVWHMFNDLELTDEMIDSWLKCQDNSILNNIKVVK